MMRVDDLVEAISALQRSDLEAWIREELVAPRQEAGTLLFTDMECARVRLICTLHYELEIDAGDSAGGVVAGRSALRHPAAPIVTDRGRSGSGQGRPSGDHRCDGAGCHLFEG